MNKKENLLKIESEPKEFSFEEGLKKIIEKIDQLLTIQDCVAIAIGGPTANDTRVGKTTLAAKIEMAFIRKNIPVLAGGSLEIFESRHADGSMLGFLQKKYHSQKCLIILDAIGLLSLPADKQKIFRMTKDRLLKKVAEKIGLTVKGVSSYILIYRPDRLPTNHQREFADIIIRNEQAKD